MDFITQAEFNSFVDTVEHFLTDHCPTCLAYLAEEYCECR